MLQFTTKNTRLLFAHENSKQNIHFEPMKNRLPANVHYFCSRTYRPKEKLKTADLKSCFNAFKETVSGTCQTVVE